MMDRAGASYRHATGAARVRGHLVKFGSLFAGIGGFDLGFEYAGMECVWQVENNVRAGAVLEHHWPNVERYGDVQDIGRHNVEAVDLVCGGFPCQDVSVAGRRKGLAGERSGLWFEFHRVLGELRPRWAVIENVPGLLSSNGGRDFAVILRGLVEIGYGVCWRVLDAQYFGVVQRRRRVFIIGHLGDGRAAEILFEREGGCWHPPPSRETGKGTPTFVIKGAAIGRKPAAGPQYGEIPVDAVYTLNTVEVHAVCTPDPAYALADASGKWNSAQAVPNLQVGEYGVRRLTPVECERLQGFPDGWTAPQSDTQRYKQLGNAVAVPVAEWIGHRIMSTQLALLDGRTWNETPRR